MGLGRAAIYAPIIMCHLQVRNPLILSFPKRGFWKSFPPCLPASLPSSFSPPSLPLLPSFLLFLPSSFPSPLNLSHHLLSSKAEGQRRHPRWINMSLLGFTQHGKCMVSAFKTKWQRNEVSEKELHSSPGASHLSPLSLPTRSLISHYSMFLVLLDCVPHSVLLLLRLSFKQVLTLSEPLALPQF